MKLFELTPFADRLGDSDWRYSINQRACRMMAEDETDARLKAGLAFGIMARVVNRSAGTGCVPWSQARLVECREIEHPGDPYLKPGRVVTDEWVIDLARPLDIDTREHLAFVASLQ